MELHHSSRAIVLPFMATLIMSTKFNDIDPQARFADVLARIADMQPDQVDETTGIVMGRSGLPFSCCRVQPVADIYVRSKTPL